MTFDELKALDHAHTLQTYGRFDVDVDHGQGATLWDLAGRTYIDFTSGIGVCSVGYGNEKWARAIYDQALTLGHISNLFYSQPYARLAGALCARSGMAAAFFGNSGAEANEGLLKLARKYSHDKYGAGRGTILTLRNSFHGRTLATLAATGQDVFHQHFFPFPEGFRHTGANDLADVEAQAGEDVCAVLLELVQGEGGVLPACASSGTGCCWWTRCRPASAAPAPSSPSSSTASGPMPSPLPRASPAACPWAASL